MHWTLTYCLNSNGLVIFFWIFFLSSEKSNVFLYDDKIRIRSTHLLKKNLYLLLWIEWKRETKSTLLWPFGVIIKYIHEMGWHLSIFHFLHFFFGRVNKFWDFENHYGTLFIFFLLTSSSLDDYKYHWISIYFINNFQIFFLFDRLIKMNLKR